MVYSFSFAAAERDSPVICSIRAMAVSWSARRLQVFLFEAEDVEIGIQQGLKILPVVLVGGEARLESGARLRESGPRG